MGGTLRSRDASGSEARPAALDQQPEPDGIKGLGERRAIDVFLQMKMLSCNPKMMRAEGSAPRGCDRLRMDFIRLDRLILIGATAVLSADGVAAQSLVVHHFVGTDGAQAY